MNKKIVVFSGVNLTVAGPLSIIQDAAERFEELYSNKFHLVLIVHSKLLFSNLLNNPNVTIKEYPWVKKSYLFRCYFEWVHCWFLSKKIKPFLWLALHDMTPNVSAKKRVVYCHNATPFYKISKEEFQSEKKFFLFTLFYKYLYRVNIRKNDFVIVQQNWMKKEFENAFKIKNVLVAQPDFKINYTSLEKEKNPYQVFTFFYPSFPRPFKNFETACEAAKLLKTKNINFQLLLTLTGNENKYASMLKEKYNSIDQVKFIGLQNRNTTLEIMNNANCILFPSKLESWGLPLTEAKFFNKNILVADLNYAHETLADYKQACFFPVNDAKKLSELMEKAINNNLHFTISPITNKENYFFSNWSSLFQFICN